LVRDNPCSGCKDREIGCHSTCDKYLDFRKRLEEKKELERQAKSENNILVGYYIQSKKKYSKR